MGEECAEDGTDLKDVLDEGLSPPVSFAISSSILRSATRDKLSLSSDSLCAGGSSAALAMAPLGGCHVEPFRLWCWAFEDEASGVPGGVIAAACGLEPSFAIAATASETLLRKTAPSRAVFEIFLEGGGTESTSGTFTGEGSSIMDLQLEELDLEQDESNTGGG